MTLDLSLCRLYCVGYISLTGTFGFLWADWAISFFFGFLFSFILVFVCSSQRCMLLSQLFVRLYCLLSVSSYYIILEQLHEGQPGSLILGLRKMYKYIICVIIEYVSLTSLSLPWHIMSLQQLSAMSKHTLFMFSMPTQLESTYVLKDYANV